MNKKETADIKSVISDVMENHLFEPLDNTTVMNIKMEIAQQIDVKDFYDYSLVAKIENHNIRVDLAVRDTVAEEFKYFTAKYDQCPAIKMELSSDTPLELEPLEDRSYGVDVVESKELLAFERAMAVIGE